MIGRVVEVQESNRYLSLHRGFLVISQTGNEKREIGRVPLDDIALVIGNAFGLSYSHNLLAEFAQRRIILVICSSNQLPGALLMPIDGNYEQSRRLDAQISASIPKQKRLWAAIVKSKLEQQALALDSVGASSTRLWNLSTRVLSGDTGNSEGIGAAYYFPMLFGSDFRRNVSQIGINSMLNYGYTILRSSVARAVVSAGLHPGLGIMHKNASNPMRLVDDLIEPFRPWVDLRVYDLAQIQGHTEMTPDVKRTLVSILYQDCLGKNGVTPIQNAIQDLATSFAQVLLNERQHLSLPHFKRNPHVQPIQHSIEL